MSSIKNAQEPQKSVGSNNTNYKEIVKVETFGTQLHHSIIKCVLNHLQQWKGSRDITHPTRIKTTVTQKNIHASNGTYRAPAYSTSEKDKEAAVNNFHSKSQKKNMGV